MKFLIDNNLSPVLARSLCPLAEREGWEVSHLRDQFAANTPDVDWIKQLGAKGGWSVISADTKILRRLHEREALRAGKVTIFALRPQWLDLTLWNQAWLLTRWFPKLVESAKPYPAGSFFTVPAKHTPVILLPE